MSARNSKKHREIIFATLTALIVCTPIVACTGMSDRVQPRRQITSCSPGQVLICTSQQPLSKGGADEIPQYEHCYCETNL